jgi:2OG-Fe(II) oxygenase superfamily
MFINYTEGIHSDSGNIVYQKDDIIVTPFFTEDFCSTLVDLCEFHRSKFIWNSKVDPYPNHELHLTDVSRFLFEDFVNHYESSLCPLFESIFLKDPIWGWFSPFINRYTMDTQRKSDLHCDTSEISFVLKLNSNYTGGDLVFPRQSFTNKDVPVGYAVIFPGTVSHPHYVSQLEYGVKYSFVSWTWPTPFSDPKGIRRMRKQQ